MTTISSARRPKTIEGYPVLNDKARGALKLAWRLSLVEDDWSKGGKVHDAWDRWTGWPYMAKFTYDLNYTVRMLAKIAQEVPAWRDVIGDAAGRIADRNRSYVAWYDWVEQKGLDPNRSSYPFFYYRHTVPPGMAGVYNAPGYCGNGLAITMDGLLQSLVMAPVEHPNPVHPYLHRHSPGVGRQYDPDPVRAHGSSNMMYKGYFLEQLGHCKSITGDKRFDAPQELIYDDDIRFTYTAEQISKTIHDQFNTAYDACGSSLAYGIDCEVGKAFPICISVGGLGMELNDRLSGNRLSYADAYKKWLARGKDNFIAGGSDPNGPCEWFSVYYDRDINYNMGTERRHAFPLFGTSIALQISPFDRPFAERMYEGCIQQFGRTEDDGSLRIVLPQEITGERVIDDVWGATAMLVCAHEFGDHDRLEKFQRWFDRAYEPTFKDGEFYYGFNLNEAWPRGIPNHWAALATIGEPGSFKRMYTEINRGKFSQPTLTGVDYPMVAVSQAIYDEKKDHLVLALTPGADASEIGKPTSFRVTNLQGQQRTIIEDGHESDRWRVGGAGEIIVETTVGDHTFMIR